MHLLLVTVGSHGDVHPFIGIGRAMRARGHRVTLATNDHFEKLSLAAGLEFAATSTEEEFRAALDDPDIWHRRRGFKAIFEKGMLPLVKPIYDLIAERYVPGETVVVAHAIAFGARIAQEKLGVPTATIHLAPAVLRSAIDPPVLPGAEMMRFTPRWLMPWVYWFADRAVIDRVVAGPVNDFRGTLGLPPVKRLLNDWWMSPQRVIALFPEWFAPPQEDWPPQVKLTGFPLFDEGGIHALSPELEAFLAGGTPPVAFTFGSAMIQAAGHLRESVEACRATGRRGLLLTRHTEQVPSDLPDGVRHFDYAPFSELLPRVAALVHHGGIGTTAQALAAGTPQLITPFAHDQLDNAARITRLGVGGSIEPKRYRAKKLAKALHRLLDDPALPARCRAVADRFKAVDALKETCDLIEELRPGVSARALT